MSLTERDRKIVLALVPILLIGAYWFLLLAPKREEAASAGQDLAVQEQRRSDAELRLASLSSAKSDFTADYAALVRLGKAVPTAVDMPTVLVQLESAARGTDITFTRITAQERQAAPVPAPVESQPADPGGAPAQSAPGQAAEAAGGAVATADSANTAAEQSGLEPGATATSQPANDGALPVGGGTAPATAGAVATSGVAGLDTVGLELEFTGDFGDLSDFFHRVKRYVELDGDELAIRGRLLTIDGVEFSSEPDIYPRISAVLTATVYLAPAGEGATAGATPTGPAVTPASGAAPVPPVATTSGATP
ncbi:MAG: hypothetical protein GXY03_06375 [Solirubrobacterales bacterium]|nr:hypothetical protein [Solirubrobacterales bacterium]